MVEHAREALDPERATVLQASLTELVLDEPVDAAFSNAVFHWIADHDALFARLHAALRPGGRLVAQCGGEGNVERFHEAARAVAVRDPYAALSRGLAGPVELRGRRGDRRAARARRLHRRRDLARALSRHAARPDQLRAHRLPRPPPRAAPRGAPRAHTSSAVCERCGTELDYVRLNIDAKTPLNDQTCAVVALCAQLHGWVLTSNLPPGEMWRMAGVPVRVLIADDQEFLAAGRSPHWIRSANSSWSAWPRARSRPAVSPRSTQPDVALVDVRSARAGPRSRSTRSCPPRPTPACWPTRAVTDADAVTGMLRAGASGYVVRDAPAEKLAAALRGARRERVTREATATGCSTSCSTRCARRTSPARSAPASAPGSGR